MSSSVLTSFMEPVAHLQVVHDLAGWKVRTIACGAGTYALAAGVPGDADNSTVTWCAVVLFSSASPWHDHSAAVECEPCLWCSIFHQLYCAEVYCSSCYLHQRCSP